MDDPDLILFVTTETLTDKSVVHNVLIGELKVPATDKDAAEALVEAIRDAIEDHSTWSVGVVIE